MNAKVHGAHFHFLPVDKVYRDQMICDYAPFVRHIAGKLATRLPPSIDVDDLISAGMLGLMDAIEKFDPSRNNKFKTYAEFRIKGAMLDELRALDWLPRSVRSKARAIDQSHTYLQHKLGRAPSAGEVARALGLDLDDYFQTLAYIWSSRFAEIDRPEHQNDLERSSIENFLEFGRSHNLVEQLSAVELKKQVTSCLKKLPENLMLVLSLYYYDDLNLKDIGALLGVSESRVSQLHSKALARILREFGALYDGRQLSF